MGNGPVLVCLLSNLSHRQSALTQHDIIHPFTPIHTPMGGATVKDATCQLITGSNLSLSGRNQHGLA